MYVYISIYLYLYIYIYTSIYLFTPYQQNINCLFFRSAARQLSCDEFQHSLRNIYLYFFISVSLYIYEYIYIYINNSPT